MSQMDIRIAGSIANASMMVCWFLQTRQYFIYWYGLFGVIEYEGNRWNLPAGWFAVGPSRFHVMFGFGEPFPDQATKLANDEQSKPNRTVINGTKVNYMEHSSTCKKGNIEQTKKEKQRQKSAREIICNSTFIGAEKW